MASPTLADLRCFEAAVRTGSISRAAKDLGVSQQAVSYRLRALERTLGLELIHRSHTGITPSEAGTSILDGASRVLTEMGALEAAIAAAQGASQETLSVAASQTIASHLLPGWLIALRHAQTRNGGAVTAVQLHTANSTKVAAMVRSGEVDLGFIETPELPPDLGTAVVGWDEMVLAVGRHSPLASSDATTLEEAARLPLVSREPGSGTRTAFEMAVSHAVGRVPANPAVVLGTEAAVRSAVAAGVAPAVLSTLTIGDDVRLGRIQRIAFAPEPLMRPLTAIWRGSGRDLGGARRELVSIASETNHR
ncbi:LysR family transcriptional regulator [Leucobacter sp. GX24907]